jgi:hypothetical protein
VQGRRPEELRRLRKLSNLEGKEVADPGAGIIG